jgi:hypothetical protein
MVHKCHNLNNTLWLFNVAMTKTPFIDDKHDDLPIYLLKIMISQFATLNNQRVISNMFPTIYIWVN